MIRRRSSRDRPQPCHEPADERAGREAGERNAGEGAVALRLGERRHRDLDGPEAEPEADAQQRDRPDADRREGTQAGAVRAPPPARRRAPAESARTRTSRPPPGLQRRRPAATGSTVASTATSSGPPTKITSCSAASSAYAVRAPSSPATVGQIERSAEETGGIVSPAAAAAIAIAAIGALDRPEDRDDPEEGRIQHHPSPQHEPRTAPIDLAAAVRRADGDGDAVGRGDEARLAVAGAAHRARAGTSASAAIPVGRRATMLQTNSAAA